MILEYPSDGNHPTLAPDEEQPKLVNGETRLLPGIQLRK
jgi:hypothetical protein